MLLAATCSKPYNVGMSETQNELVAGLPQRLPQNFRDVACTRDPEVDLVNLERGIHASFPTQILIFENEAFAARHVSFIASEIEKANCSIEMLQNRIHGNLGSSFFCGSVSRTGRRVQIEGARWKQH